MQSPTHIECSLVFPSQETGTNTFSLSRGKFKQSFLSSISHARVAFSLANLRNVFQLTASGVNADASTWLLPSDLFRTYSQPLGRMANFSQSKRVFSCNPVRDLRESCYTTQQANFRLQASTTRTYAHNWAIFKRYASEPTQDKLNREKMADMIATGTHGVSNSRLLYMYT